MSYDEAENRDNPVTAGDAPTPEAEVSSTDQASVGSGDPGSSGDDHEAGGNPAAETAGISAVPSEEEQAEIEEERKRRLAPENRPENAEVVHSGEIPESDPDGEGSVGTADPTKAFREAEVSEEEKRQIAEDREKRLAPENRPENAEVDNSGTSVPDDDEKDE